jgi:hypothetical protein
VDKAKPLPASPCQGRSKSGIPASLAKHGILRVSDNIPDGMGVDFNRAFMQVFRPELEAGVIRNGKKPCATVISLPCPSGK